MPDKKKKDAKYLPAFQKTYTANQVDSIIKNSDLTFRDFTEKYNKNTGKTYYIKKVKTGGKYLPAFPGEEKPGGKYINLKKGGITKKKTMKKDYMKKMRHGGMTMNSPSLLDNVKTTYEMGGVMKEYGMGGKLKEVGPNQKGLSMLPKKVRNKMGYMKKGGMMKEYGKGGKMEYGHGGMMSGGMMKQHD